MSAPNDEKNNDHIRGDPTAFHHAYLRARDALGALDGVVGVGYGRKETGGKFTDDLAIEVFVREKKPDSRLSDEQRVPKRFEGYRTDVRIVPRAVESADTGPTVSDLEQYPTISGGIMIEAFPRFTNVLPPAALRGPGTLGCIVKRRGDTGSDNVYLLTCAHVIQATGTGDRDYIYQPQGPLLEGGIGAGQIIGIIDGDGEKGYEVETASVPTSATDPTPVQKAITCYVDVGIAKIDVQSKCCDTPCGTKGVPVDTSIVHLTDLGLPTNAITDVRDLLVDPTIATSGENVYKRGAVTRGTVGTVTAVNGHLDMTLPDGTVTTVAQNVIEIAFVPTTAQSKNNQGDLAFSAHGDSGAIVLDGQNRAIGMIFGEEPHAPKTQPTDVLTYKVYACHIRAVLDAMKVCVVTTGGTSYGADGATDGSGLIGAADASTDVGGERKFVSAERVVRVRRPNFDPLTSDQRDRFIHLRDALRQSERGRRLDDTFLEVRQEIGVLVRSYRPVTVVWHRNRGPALLAHVINHLRGNTPSVPLEIDGVTRATLFERMREVLTAHGSGALRRALDRHASDVAWLGGIESVDECIALLEQMEADTSTGAPA